MQYSILGPLEVVHDGSPVHLGGAKRRKVLAILLLRANQQVSAEALMEALWGDEPPATAGKTLQTHVSHLRKLLEPQRPTGEPWQWLQTIDSAYSLRVDPDQIDSARFEALVREARAAIASNDHDRGHARLVSALKLWRGPVLGDMASESFSQAEAARLEEVRLSALELRIATDLELGRHAEVAPEIEEAVRTHPFREGFTGHLMVALYRCGRQADSLSAFKRLRDSLVDELGIEPGPHLQELYQRVLRQDPTLAAAPTHRTGSAPIRRGHLPTPFTSFVGRGHELEQVTDLCRQYRLVTVVGPPGIGKTRLVLEVAAAIAPHGAAMFADLSNAHSDEEVTASIARALGVLGDPETPLREALLEAARDLQGLLVVDNCEHVLAAAASLAFDLLAASEGTRVLATSRQPLGVPGEATLTLQPLAVPEESADPDSIAKSDAVSLFVERARAAAPHFDLTEDNAGSMAAICRRLDGLPLAIELVAPRLRTFAPKELEELLSERFQLLEAANPGAIARHRTVTAAIEWSYELLEPLDRILFERMAVFPGTFGYEAVLEVCSDDRLNRHGVARRFARLVDRSMVVSIDAGSAPTRYRLLEALRMFAEARLHATEDFTGLADRHSVHYLALAETASPELRGPQQRRWLSRLEQETTNLRACIERAVDRGDTTTVARFVAALGLFWDDRGPRREALEWMRWLSRQDIEASGAPLVDALATSAELMGSWNLEEAFACAQLAVRAAEGGEPRVRARALEALGAAHAYRNPIEATAILEEVLGLFTEFGDVWHQARVNQALSLCAPKLEDALGRGQESVRLWEQTGDAIRTANALYIMAARAVDAEIRLDSAEQWLNRSLGLARSAGARHEQAHAELQLGRIARLRGDDGRAGDLVDVALPVLRKVGDLRCVGRSLVETAILAARSGRTDDALSALDESIRASERVKNRATALALELLGAALHESGRDGPASFVMGAAEAARASLGPTALRRPPSVIDFRHRLESDDVLEAAFDRGMKVEPIEALNMALPPGIVPDEHGALHPFT